MNSVNVYNFVYDALLEVVNSEDYTRIILLGVSNFEIIFDDEEILSKGLNGFKFENPLADGWEGLSIYINTNYYSLNNKNLDTYELDCCILCLLNTGNKYEIENNYFIGENMYPFSWDVIFCDKVIYYDYFSIYYMLDCEKCTNIYNVPVNYSQFRMLSLGSQNKHVFKELIYDFKLILYDKDLLRKYYVLYETLNNKRSDFKINKLVVKMDISEIDYLNVFYNILLPKIKLKNYYLSLFANNVYFSISVDKDKNKNNDYITLFNKLKELRVISDYKIDCF